MGVKDWRDKVKNDWIPSEITDMAFPGLRKPVRFWVKNDWIPSEITDAADKVVNDWIPSEITDAADKDDWVLIPVGSISMPLKKDWIPSEITDLVSGDMPSMPSLPPPPLPPDMTQYYRAMSDAQRAQNQVAGGMLDIAKRQGEIAEEQYAKWKELYRPVEKEVVSGEDIRSAPAYRSGLRRNVVMQAGTAGIQRIPTELGIRRGVTADSPTAVSAVKEAAATVGEKAAQAATSGRESEEYRGLERKLELAAYGVQIPKAIVAGYGQASGVMGGASDTMAKAASQAAGVYQSVAAQQQQTTMNQWQNQAAMQMAQYNAEMQRAMNEQAMRYQMFMGVAQMGSTVLVIKAILGCVPGRQCVDTIRGPVKIEDIKVGDVVIGMDGKPCIVRMKHQYLEDESRRFVRIFLDIWNTIEVSDMHRIRGKAAADYRVGDVIADGRVVESVEYFSGVRVSYDILTDGPGGGYCMGGVPVESMIERMMT